MSFELIIFLFTLFGLAGIGTPVGYSIITASIMYFIFGDMDVALAGEKIIQGLYKSFVLLAVPLFITAANIMNAGTITDRLLNFCTAKATSISPNIKYIIDAVIIEYPTGVPIPASPNKVNKKIINSKLITINIL